MFINLLEVFTRKLTRSVEHIGKKTSMYGIDPDKRKGLSYFKIARWAFSRINFLHTHKLDKSFSSNLVEEWTMGKKNGITAFLRLLVDPSFIYPLISKETRGQTF